MGSALIEKFESVMMPVASKISGNKYLLAMRDSFSMLLPFIIVGSFFGIMQWVVLDPWGTLLGENGMNLGASITGLMLTRLLVLYLPFRFCRDCATT